MLICLLIRLLHSLAAPIYRTMIANGGGGGDESEIWTGESRMQLRLQLDCRRSSSLSIASGASRRLMEAGANFFLPGRRLISTLTPRCVGGGVVVVSCAHSNFSLVPNRASCRPNLQFSLCKQQQQQISARRSSECKLLAAGRPASQRLPNLLGGSVQFQWGTHTHKFDL